GLDVSSAVCRIFPEGVMAHAIARCENPRPSSPPANGAFPPTRPIRLRRGSLPRRRFIERTVSMIQPLRSTRHRITTNRIALAASLAIALSVASPAHAQVAKFSGIHDAVPLKFFDSAATRPDPTNRNKLIIGFDSGLDQTTFTSNEFVAYSYHHAMDTISFTVTAPTGYYVAKITFTQRGIGSLCRTCYPAGSAHWRVAGHPANLGAFFSDPTLTGAADLTASKPQSVAVSITDSLFATTGSVKISGAEVVVRLAAR